MGTKFGYKTDKILIQALKHDGTCMPITKKFDVNPEKTTFKILRDILAKEFGMKQNFSITYRVLDDYGQETYLPVLTDWDLDAAFVSTTDSCLCLRLEAAIFEEVPTEWIENQGSVSRIADRKLPDILQGLILNRVGKTVNMVKEAFNMADDALQSDAFIEKEPLTDAEFKAFLDPVGQLIHARQFRKAIYFRGVDPSLRRVVWKHLLNVYPNGLSGKERIEYVSRKCEEYKTLKKAWYEGSRHDQMKQELKYVTSMVRKDVLRTDRHHKFYAGDDENSNTASLFNILTTYALNHPSVSYCQGMSDLASPLLVTMKDEAHAYICFCSLMKRLGSNFLLDGVTMTTKFQHLTDGLKHYDPQFYAYIKSKQADDLLFCYRWLLLEMKREFAFEDALRMLEVMWSSIPPPATFKEELPLFEIEFQASYPFPPASLNLSDAPYAKIRALRRRRGEEGGRNWRLNRSLDESAIAKRRLSKGRSCGGGSKQFTSLDDVAVIGEERNNNDESGGTLSPKSESLLKMVKNLNEFSNLKEMAANKRESEKRRDSKLEREEESSSSSCSSSDSSEYSPLLQAEPIRKKNINNEVYVWQNPLNEANGAIVCSEGEGNLKRKLPPPHVFGEGNPFLIFLCVTLLKQHSGVIMKAGMDYNEIAMYFDKMVRKHDVNAVLAETRMVYDNYLKSQDPNYLNC